MKKIISPNKKIDYLHQSKDSNRNRHRNRQTSNYFSNRNEIYPFAHPSLIHLSDLDQADDIKTSIDGMLQEAKHNGFPATHFDKLSHMIWQRKNVFRTTFSAGSPAAVPPLRIRLRADAVPTIVKLRKYTYEQKLFLRKLMKQLIDLDYIYPNPKAKWALAPDLVPKPGPDGSRFTGDLRPINKWTILECFRMPNVDQELEKSKESKFYADFDMTHGYWQFLVHRDDRETQSIITPDGIVTPGRLLNGNVNANSHLQASLVSTMSPRLKNRLLL